MKKIPYLYGMVLFFALATNVTLAQRSLVNKVWQTQYDSPFDTIP